MTHSNRGPRKLLAKAKTGTLICIGIAETACNLPLPSSEKQPMGSPGGQPGFKVPGDGVPGSGGAGGEGAGGEGAGGAHAVGGEGGADDSGDP